MKKQKDIVSLYLSIELSNNIHQYFSIDIMNCRGNIMRLYEKQETKRSKEIKQHLQRMDDKAYEIGKNLGNIERQIDYGIELSIKFQDMVNE